MYFLSIDPARKNLALLFLKVSNEYEDDLKEIKIFKKNKEYIFFVKIIFNKLLNIMDNNPIEQTRKLKKELKDLCLEQYKSNITVLIENQPDFNRKSNIVFNQLVYEFIDYDVKILGASLKNLIYLNSDLKHNSFLKKYNNNYKANKEHAKETYLYFLRENNLNYLLDDIEKKYDDIADCFCMICTFICK